MKAINDSSVLFLPNTYTRKYFYFGSRAVYLKKLEKPFDKTY